jgi:hypothetical protein
MLVPCSLLHGARLVNSWDKRQQEVAQSLCLSNSAVFGSGTGEGPQSF